MDKNSDTPSSSLHSWWIKKHFVISKVSPITLCDSILGNPTCISCLAPKSTWTLTITQLGRVLLIVAMSKLIGSPIVETNEKSDSFRKKVDVDPETISKTLLVLFIH